MNNQPVCSKKNCKFFPYSNKGLSDNSLHLSHLQTYFNGETEYINKKNYLENDQDYGQNSRNNNQDNYPYLHVNSEKIKNFKNQNDDLFNRLHEVFLQLFE